MRSCPLCINETSIENFELLNIDNLYLITFIRAPRRWDSDIALFGLEGHLQLRLQSLEFKLFM